MFHVDLGTTLSSKKKAFSEFGCRFLGRLRKVVEEKVPFQVFQGPATTNLIIILAFPQQR